MKTLREAVALVESSNNTNAARYEVRWTPKNQSNFLKYNGWMDETTVDVLLQTSFGKYQIMCDVLYSDEIGYTGKLNDFYDSESLQEEYFEKYCESIGFGGDVDKPINLIPNLLEFAVRYNGSPAYAISLRRVAGG